ncbi:MAG: hypothetical protein JWL73_1127 [Actinomycetia bacterium]|nr:hypothetical protein [Actinomycetes bacterium]
MAPLNLDEARQVADAMLFEGYLLYPYRASATKNQHRWQFGVLAPIGADTGDPSVQRTECLLEADDSATVEVHVRFLQLETRGEEQLWDEGDPVERTVTAEVGELVRGDVVEPIVESGAARERGGVRFVREPLEARVTVSAERLPGPYGGLRLRILIENTGRWDANGRGNGSGSSTRDAVMRRSLIGAHVLVGVQGGRFVSLLEPPEWAMPAVDGCSNVGTFPVLVGDRDDIVLSSPIILYDHPQIAPESAGQLFDATEIDEILTLRTLALTDAEKAEARDTDPRAAEIIDRVEDMPAEIFERLHGAIRSLRPVRPDRSDAVPTVYTPVDGDGDAERHDDETAWWDPAADAGFAPDRDAVTIDGVAVRRGSRVRLRPGRHADAQDMFWSGRIATVTAVLHDVDGNRHVAVIPVDDPGADVREWQGRFLYFDPSEVEPVETEPMDDAAVRR